MSHRTSPLRARQTYEFIKANQGAHDIELMCRLLSVARSGYYAWLKSPTSNRAAEDARLLKLIRASYRASHGIYGAPRVFLDLREAGETCSRHRVARLMRVHKIKALHGYRRRPYSATAPSPSIPDLVKRRFDVVRPNTVWVTDITYIRTWEGWLYLAVVMDLYSRRIVGWATGPSLGRELVLDATLKAVRSRKPRGTIVHSDQGCQYGSDDWQRFCKSNRLRPSMSRKGNCYDNAVAESFFASLKKERVKKRIYRNRDLATADVSDYIDSFYNPSRRHRHLAGISPEDFEARERRAKCRVH